MINLIIEFWTFLRVRKKLWLAPLIIIMTGLGGLLVLAEGSIFSPFIYSLFQISMYILGISAWYHDSSACLLKDGEILYAAQEERFSRIKHDNRFPINAVNFCIDEANILPEEISFVVYQSGTLFLEDGDFLEECTFFLLFD